MLHIMLNHDNLSDIESNISDVQITPRKGNTWACDMQWRPLRAVVDISIWVSVCVCGGGGGGGHYSQV